MGSAERKERHKSDLRDKILKVSQKIVLREGVDALTIRRVAEKIEYSPGALYLYFQSRDEIIHELGRIGLQTLLSYLRPSQDLAAPADRLAALARAYVTFGDEHAESYRLIFMLDSEAADAIFGDRAGKSTDGAEAFALLAGAFQALQQDNSLYAQIDPARTALLFWTALHGIVSLKISCAKFLQTPAETLAADTTALFLAGLRAPR